MSLRFRLFILFGVLFSLGMLAQWLLVRTLAEDVGREVETIASNLGKDIVRVIGSEHLPTPLEPREGAFFSGTSISRERRTVVFRGEGTAAKGATFSFHTVESLREKTSPGDGLPGPVSGKASVRVLMVEGPNLRARIPIPEGGVGAALADFRNRLVLGSLAILAAGLVAAAFVADRVSAPLRDLSRAAMAVGEGALGSQVGRRAGGEVGEAIGAFNRMSTRLADLEREAVAMRERQHLSELGEVARGLAHALRNPLHAIGLSADELASRVPASPEVDAMRESVRTQIRNIDASIRSFLALAGGPGATVEETDGRELVEEVALAALQEARGRVRVHVEERAPSRLRGVPAEMKAAVQALVVNAIEASPDGASVRVRVGPAEGGGLEVDVADDGPGLPAEVRGRLFTPHVTTKPSGSGMGLYLAHRIATGRYAGTLEVADGPAGGTRARLVLRDRGEAVRG